MTDVPLSHRRPFALRWPVLLVVGVLAVALVGVAGWKVGSYLRPHAYHGMILQSPQPAPNFTLTDQHGRPVSLKDFRGKLVMLFFGYTTCPDVCPVTLSVVNKARESLGADAKDVQVVMVSVDPQRDTPEVMGEYVARYDPSFIGLTGAPDKIAETATYYGVYYNAHPVASALGYLVDHTATVMVVDREGYLRLIFPFGISVEDMADDLSYLLNR